ncbi:two-component system chemotaxis response regulator CheY [Rhizomicrobium palustre]|uniref:Two-component system chemotaxis response regulator CheY n=1 Tax=Rhizomicrobium palustre TaxID=189966 RepID=A0A846MZC5_9PROT|nr:response regulator [Rhizomicrobium palustre]NIK89014.1 two-component system chemotaxis response regulator CheY [Rhizomicrobium palustre]
MKTCLVVDDSRVIRKVACAILKELSFETEEAENGAQALVACRRQMPDVILVDWQMPSMSGVEFLRALNHEIFGRRPAVLFCTTENDPANISEAVNAGAGDYIVKPYDRKILATKLAEMGLV